MTECLIGLGSNLGDRKAILDEAVARLGRQLEIVKVSKWFTYPAVGGPGDQDDFLNGCLLASANCSAHEVAKILHDVEHAMGRERIVRWSSRTLDCDLLLAGDAIIETPALQVPHPRMITRRFVLEPACDVAADAVHPWLGWTMRRLLQHLDHPPWFCVRGDNPAVACELMNAIHAATGGSMYDKLPIPRETHKDPLGYTSAVLEFVEQHFASSDESLITSFSPWDPWLADSHDELLRHASAAKIGDARIPKLTIVSAPAGSRMAESFRSLPRQLRSPTLFLPADMSLAIQDAVGAVMAMKSETNGCR